MHPTRLLLIGSLALLASACTRETTIADHDGQALVAALRAAQAGSGSQRIVLARRGSYVLSAPSETGLLLPSITGKLTIEGNGAEIRSYHDGNIALLEVGREGDVTLRNLALAEGSDGAIRNFGNLRLVSTRVFDSTGNRASSIVLNRGRLQLQDSVLAHNSLDGDERDTSIVLNYGELLLDKARVQDNFVAHGVNGVLNLGRGRIEGDSVAINVRNAGP
jgi:hypothetical protein